MARIRVLIADDNALIRAGLAEVLGQAEGIEVVGQAADGDAAVAKAKALDPDLVVMDLRMPKCNGLQATHRLRLELPETRVLMLTISEDEADLISAIEAGARGYILKNEDTGLLVEAVQYVAHGGTIVSPKMAMKLVSSSKKEKPRVADPPLSSKEDDILQLLAQGASDKQIALRMSTTERWVETHLSNILHKLRLGTRRQAEIYSATMGTVQTSPKMAGPETREAGPRVPSTPQMADDSAIAVENGQSSSEPSLAEVELIISPPLEPASVLRLQAWLRQVGMAEITEIIPSRGRETVVRMRFAQPLPLFGLLSELPLVAEVSDEPKSGASSVTRLRVTLETA